MVPGLWAFPQSPGRRCMPDSRKYSTPGPDVAWTRYCDLRLKKPLQRVQKPKSRDRGCFFAADRSAPPTRILLGRGPQAVPLWASRYCYPAQAHHPLQSSWALVVLNMRTTDPANPQGAAEWTGFVHGKRA
ncbi:hypothetical protein CSUI_001896 [Cystoisospora suis]|uniref:Uncharacterized protein n=1 Tax=Cystoisospora suis TaxID=483139 RepID=A0A2C6LA35_9APIC|nr:hypothetical protein CSUI_001896 [Cystoisospora suis]